MSTVPTTPLAPESSAAASRRSSSLGGEELAAFLDAAASAKEQFLSGARNPVDRVYRPRHVADTHWEDVGLPGRFPYTRGPYPTMYRARPWTMRQIAGFGTPEDTNERFHYLIAQGQTGISVDFDMPTLMGFDSDDPSAFGEVGREGVAIDPLDDMEALFDGIDLEQISVSMTINPTAWILLAMYVAVAEERGIRPRQARPARCRPTSSRSTSRRRSGSTRSRASMRIVRDMITFCRRAPAALQPDQHLRLPHLRGRGERRCRRPPSRWRSRVAYVREVTARAWTSTTFAPRLSFFFVSPLRLLRGGREVPGAAPRLREDHARRVRRPEARSRCGCASTARPPRRR